MTRTSSLHMRIGSLCLVFACLTSVLSASGGGSLSKTTGASRADARTHSTLRVGMWTLWHDRQLQVSPAGSATLRTCAHCSEHPLKRVVALRAVGDRVAGAFPTPQPTLSIDGTITVVAHGESETLHHPLTITARNGELILAVTLPVETYVERVTASESGPSDTPESLKALAIVVRTYALHVPHGHRDYDLCDSTHCQLLHWHGVPGRAAAARAATLATAGETLWFRHQPALAYFNKDCGGFTASPDQIWPNGRVVPYLPARSDSYCLRTGGNDWASELPRNEVASALAARGLAPPGWKHLSTARRAPSGRVLTVRIDNREISAENFRLAIGAALGWNRIPSTWFEVSEQGEAFHFHGRGWGHGVGLCQKGAAAMAAQGQSTSEILRQYFPGAEVADDATGRAWTTLSGPGFVLETLDSSAAHFLPAVASARAAASERSGLDPAATLTIRAFPSTSAFRDATLAPGWVAAFTEGDFIATQPLSILSARHLLDSTLLHEFLHALVERHCSAAAPLWLREGLAEFWSLPHASAKALGPRPPAIPLPSLDSALAHAGSEAQSAAAHQAAAIYAARLLERYGPERVLAWLGSGVPSNVLVTAR